MGPGGGFHLIRHAQRAEQTGVALKSNGACGGNTLKMCTKPGTKISPEGTPILGVQRSRAQSISQKGKKSRRKMKKACEGGGRIGDREIRHPLPKSITRGTSPVEES